MKIEARHVLNATKARALYLDSMNPAEARADWVFAVREARELAADALRSSNFLRDIAAALGEDGGYSVIFRQMLSPPLSQDQVKLTCPAWSKGRENRRVPLNPNVASAVGKVVYERMDYSLAPWLKAKRRATRADVTAFLKVVSALLANQRVPTARRNRLAFEQEFSVIELLQKSGWKKMPAKLIDIRAAVPPRCFMHKTRFATATTTSQEVDIACGLPKTFVLAMECKVTNDETNSVKRINDVLKKATAWKQHWGTFVTTAALLQGVIAAKDVQRLTDHGVEVFWSHDLEEFAAWLALNA